MAKSNPRAKVFGCDPATSKIAKTWNLPEMSAEVVFHSEFQVGEVASIDIRDNGLLEPRIVDELTAGTPKGQEIPVEVLDEYLEVVTEGRKL